MKHAYLITAHHNLEVLKYTLSMLDDQRNVVFLLADKKAKNFNPEILVDSMHHAELVNLPRITINWGGLSQIKAELNLIEAAVQHECDFSYLHFLQGMDLPIKTQEEVHEFFEKNKGYEFIAFNPDKYRQAQYKKYYYHFLVDNRFYRNNKVLIMLNHALAYIQKAIGIQRDKTNQLYSGSALFSITEDFARYVLKHKREILHEYKHTLACDEVFLHTLIMKSEFKRNIYTSENPYKCNARYIDRDSPHRQRNSPVIFTIDDFGTLINAGEGIMFARKFDQNIDIDVVKMLYEHIKQQST